MQKRSDSQRAPGCLCLPVQMCSLPPCPDALSPALLADLSLPLVALATLPGLRSCRGSGQGQGVLQGCSLWAERGLEEDRAATAACSSQALAARGSGGSCCSSDLLGSCQLRTWAQPSCEPGLSLVCSLRCLGSSHLPLSVLAD